MLATFSKECRLCRGSGKGLFGIFSCGATDCKSGKEYSKYKYDRRQYPEPLDYARQHSELAFCGVDGPSTHDFYDD